MAQEIWVDPGEKVDAELFDAVWKFVVDMYGPAHSRVRIFEVRYYQRRHAMTAYIDADDPFLVSILLPEHQREDQRVCAVLLAHEIVHCLTPNGPAGLRATLLEEGLAEFASMSLCAIVMPEFDYRSSLSGRYRTAVEALERVIEIEGIDALLASIVDLRRTTGKPFADIQVDDLSSSLPNTPLNILQVLSERFHV